MPVNVLKKILNFSYGCKDRRKDQDIEICCMWQAVVNYEFVKGAQRTLGLEVRKGVMKDKLRIRGMGKNRN